IVAEERVLGPKGSLRAKIVLENKSKDEVVLRPGAGSPLGQITVDYEELLPDGTRAMRRSTRAVHSEAEIRLAPGARRELALGLADEHAEKGAGVVGRYRISGRLRPFTMLAGEEPLP